MLQLNGENNVLIALYDIFGSGSAFNFLLVRNPLLRNFFPVETASATPLPFRESASCGVAELRTYPRYRTALILIDLNWLE